MVITLALLLFRSRTLEVGPGKEFDRIEAAVRAAVPGDSIRVSPSPNGYAETAVLINKPNIRIEASVPGVVLDGARFDYSGVGTVPRAIVQFEPTAAGSSLKGFVLSGAHNRSFNGAGVRINNCKDVCVADCEITACDMGVMSAGAAASNQSIVNCHIHHNGTMLEPGQNHNLYLGGESVSLTNCEIDHSLTGHNVKSRAHITKVSNCFIHDSANREFDFVESVETSRPGSDALLNDNLIIKAATSGNGNVLHFGHEAGRRIGTLFLQRNTIITPVSSPVFLVSDLAASVRLEDNLIVSNGRGSRTLIAFTNGGSGDRLLGRNNWIDSHFSASSSLSMAEPPLLPGSFWNTYQLDNHPAVGCSVPKKWLRALQKSGN